MSTYFPKAGDLQDKWFVIDAKGEVVGRLASRLAGLLRGKTDATFHPAVDPRNFVVVVNADKAILTGRKMRQKLYHRHSGYPGGLKTINADELSRKKPGEILRLAVKGMLPKNSLGAKLLGNCNFYAGTEHPHQAQQPQEITLTKSRAAAAGTTGSEA